MIEERPSKPPARKARRSISQEGPDPVDVHVGGRIRLRRTLMGLSQTALAQAIGLTFQQVQKYERGTNRVSASTLHRLSGALDVPVAFFFDGMDGAAPHPAQAPAGPISREGLLLLRNYDALSTTVRRQVYALLSVLNKGPADEGN